MSESDQDYELEILKMVINQHLDERTSLTESSLNVLQTMRDQVVWDIATKIYGQSGYRVELSLVRDIVNSRIGTLKSHLVEEARRAAERKAQQEAEEARRVAEQKAQQKAEEARRVAEQKAQQKAEEARRVAERKAQQEAEEARRATESNPQLLAERKAEIFVRVRKVISEQLSVDEAKVALDSHLSNDLSADPLHFFELLIALEEEFDIEISEEAFENRLDWKYPKILSLLTSSEGRIGKKAIVRNVVELIWENAPYFWKDASY